MIVEGPSLLYTLNRYLNHTAVLVQPLALPPDGAGGHGAAAAALSDGPPLATLNVPLPLPRAEVRGGATATMSAFVFRGTFKAGCCACSQERAQALTEVLLHLAVTHTPRHPTLPFSPNPLLPTPQTHAHAHIYTHTAPAPPACTGWQHGRR